MNNYDEQFVENALKELKEHSREIKDEKTRLILTSKIDTYLAQYEGEDEVVISTEIAKQLIKKPLPAPVPTGHIGLDNIIKGFYPGQHIVFSAPPKSGKTAFILDLIARMKEHSPMFIPLEQNAEELISIMQERNLEVPIFAVPRTNKKATMQWLTERITESVIKYDTKVVFIDHFGYIQMVEGKDQHHLKITDTMQALRSIAKQLNISIVSIVHVRKVDPTQPPTVEDLYGSAGYLQEADTIVMLWREAYKDGRETKWTNKVLCSVQANRRNGNTGSFRMKFEDYKFKQDDNIVFHYESNDPDNEEQMRERLKNY